MPFFGISVKVPDGELNLGQEKQGTMKVEYAVALRIEPIPEGHDGGPVKVIYFKIF